MVVDKDIIYFQSSIVRKLFYMEILSSFGCVNGVSSEDPKSRQGR
jgi:hypothetical protein